MGEVDNNNVYMRVLENTMCRIFCMISNDALQNKLYRIDDIEEQVDLICQSCETYPAPFHRGCPYILSNDQLICPRVKPNLPQLRSLQCRTAVNRAKKPMISISCR